MSENTVFQNVLSKLDKKLQNLIREDAGRYTFLGAVTEDDLISFTKGLLDHRFSHLPKINNLDHLKDFCIFQFAKEKNEIFSVMFMDSQVRLIAFKKLSIGSVSQVLMHSKNLFEKILEYNAAAIVFIHNHPSGDVIPSKKDKQSTKKCQSFLKFIGVCLLDHVIVGGGKAFSMRENGLL